MRCRRSEGRRWGERAAWTACLGAALTLATAGCAHDGGSRTTAVDTIALNSGAIVEMPNGELRKAFDLNGDNKPDAFEYYAPAKDEKGAVLRDRDGKASLGPLLRKEFDLNLDGKIDFWRWYDDKENVIKESEDMNFDGKPDRTTYFEKGQRVREESEFSDDGKPHKWIYYEKNQIAEIERDLHGTGKADYFEYWENGVIDRIGIDRKDTGHVDFWEQNPETASK